MDEGNHAVAESRVVLEKSRACYQEVRHIVLAGTNEEIGRALAGLSRNLYQARPLPFSSREDKERRDGYIRAHAPVMAARQQGVEAEFGWNEGDLFDSSSLWYDIQPVNCSAIFFPGSVTAAGHSFQARNMDFYTVDLGRFAHPESGGEADGTNNGHGSRAHGNRLFSRNFVLQTHPRDGGYAAIAVGTFDLLNGAYDGFNEKGLCISGLVDQNLAQKTVPLSALEKQAGLSYLQMARTVLEEAATVAEARALVQKIKVYFPMDGMHFLIGDRHGDAMFLEFSEQDLSPRFMAPAVSGPSIITNHSRFRYPEPGSFPPVDGSKPYDTFYRYLRLDEFLRRAGGRGFTPEDGFEAMSRVYGFVDDASEGTALPLPLRTIWSLVMDLDELSLRIRFYTEDDEKKKAPLFSEEFLFGLGNN